MSNSVTDYGPYSAEMPGLLAEFLESKASGLWSFEHFAALAGVQVGGGPTPERVQLAMHLARRVVEGLLEQIVIVDDDPEKEFPSLIAVPNKVDGKAMTLDRLQLRYRFRKVTP